MDRGPYILWYYLPLPSYFLDLKLNNIFINFSAHLKYENYYHPQKATVTAGDLAKPKHSSMGRHPAAGKAIGVPSPIPTRNITSQVLIEDNGLCRDFYPYLFKGKQCCLINIQHCYSF